LTVELPDEASQTREAFTFDQVESILRIADSEWRTAIMLGAYARMRLGDTVALTWSNIDLANETIKFVPQKTSRGRRRKELVLPIHPTLLQHLNELPGADRGPAAALIPGLAARRISGRRGLSRDFLALVVEATIECEAMERPGTDRIGGRKFRKLSFHSLRHTFNSVLANAGVDQEVRQQLTGHASAEMNKRYTHLELKTMRSAIGKLPIWSGKRT
jgi:integrase